MSEQGGSFDIAGLAGEEHRPVFAHAAPSACGPSALGRWLPQRIGIGVVLPAEVSQ
jgi:hypothetical protein